MEYFIKTGQIDALKKEIHAAQDKPILLPPVSFDEWLRNAVRITGFIAETVQAVEWSGDCKEADCKMRAILPDVKELAQQFKDLVGRGGK